VIYNVRGLLYYYCYCYCYYYYYYYQLAIITAQKGPPRTSGYCSISHHQTLFEPSPLPSPIAMVIVVDSLLEAIPTRMAEGPPGFKKSPFYDLYKAKGIRQHRVVSLAANQVPLILVKVNPCNARPFTQNTTEKVLVEEVEEGI